MTTALLGRVSAFLRHAGLVTALLAVVAGIFGMHVMSGAHAVPAAAVAEVHGALKVPGPGADADTAHSAVTASLGSETGPGLLSSCTGISDCPSMAEMDSTCVLSAAKTSLSAPPPGAAPFHAPGASAAGAATTLYAYVPTAPSPGDFCVSRT